MMKDFGKTSERVLEAAISRAGRQGAGVEAMRQAVRQHHEAILQGVEPSKAWELFEEVLHGKTVQAKGDACQADGAIAEQKPKPSPDVPSGQKLPTPDLGHSLEKASKFDLDDNPNQHLPSSTASNYCELLIDLIVDLADEMAQREYDLLRDNRNLFELHRSKKDAHPVFGSYKGHQDYYEGLRGYLIEALKNFDFHCKDDDDGMGGYVIVEYYGRMEGFTRAQEQVGKEAPEEPKNHNRLLDMVARFGGVIRDGAIYIFTGLGAFAVYMLRKLADPLGLPVRYE